MNPVKINIEYCGRWGYLSKTRLFESICYNIFIPFSKWSRRKIDLVFLLKEIIYSTHCQTAPSPQTAPFFRAGIVAQFENVPLPNCASTPENPFGMLYQYFKSRLYGSFHPVNNFKHKLTRFLMIEKRISCIILRTWAAICRILSNCAVPPKCAGFWACIAAQLGIGYCKSLFLKMSSTNCLSKYT